MLLRGTMQDVGNLLNYPKQLNWCEMKPEYFETEELQEIVTTPKQQETNDNFSDIDPMNKQDMFKNRF